jgi:hypothetical protein
MFTRSKHIAPRAIALLAAILSTAALGIAPLASPSIARAESLSSVTTEVRLPLGSGSLDATFVAQTTDNGAWDISADFSPRGVTVHRYRDRRKHYIIPHLTLDGTGHASATALPGIPADITVTGLYWRSSGGVYSTETLHFTIVVDADGVVSFV